MDGIKNLFGELVLRKCIYDFFLRMNKISIIIITRMFMNMLLY